MQIDLAAVIGAAVAVIEAGAATRHGATVVGARDIGGVSELAASIAVTAALRCLQRLLTAVTSSTIAVAETRVATANLTHAVVTLRAPMRRRFATHAAMPTVLHSVQGALAAVA